VGLTTRVKIGTSVLVVPYRNPVVTAKMLATLDVMSGGRLILGVGVGWMKEEFEAVQAPAFGERGKVTDEYLRLMRAMWTLEPAEFTGAHYRLPSVSALPKPRQKGGIPIWVGGHTDAALRRTGELADVWHPIAMRPPAMLLPDEYAQKVEVIRGWARRAGRDPKSIGLSVRVPLELAPRSGKGAVSDLPGFRGSAADVVRHIRGYQALGVTHFVFDPASSDLKGQLTQMERFAREVRPKVQRAPR
jgi:probable F420-dependent oxidoreductase